MAIQTKTMVVKSDTALAETKTTIRDTVTFDTSKLPNGITYKGLKAVLSFAEPIQWNKASTYDALTVVWDDASHGSYASKRHVPANIELTNEFYWLRTADLDAQVEMYRQEVRELDGRVTANEQAIDTEKTRIDDILKNRLDNYVTPEQFGAVGDGVHDDTGAIVSAMDTGKLIVLGNKKYLIKRDIELKAGVSFLGNQLNSTLVFDNASFVYTKEDYKASYISFINVHFVPLTAHVNVKPAFNCKSLLYLMLYNCWFQGFDTALYFSSIYDSYFTNLVLYDCGTPEKSVIVFDKQGTSTDGCNNVYFTNIRVEGGNGTALYTADTSTNQIWIKNFKSENANNTMFDLSGFSISITDSETYYAEDFDGVVINLRTTVDVTIDRFYCGGGKAITGKLLKLDNCNNTFFNGFLYYDNFGVYDIVRDWHLGLVTNVDKYSGNLFYTLNGQRLDSTYGRLIGEPEGTNSITATKTTLVIVSLTGPINFRYRIHSNYNFETSINLEDGERDYINVILPVGDTFSCLKYSGSGSFNLSTRTHGFIYQEAFDA